MGVQTYTLVDTTSPVLAARFFNALAIDNHNFMPKVLPDMVKSVEIVQGEPNAVGCIAKVNFPEGAPFKYVKQKIDVFDATNFYIKYTSFEGDVLRDTLEYVVYEHKYEPSGTGCHYTMTAHYQTKGEYVMTEEEIATGKGHLNKMFKDVEAYLIANPQAYV